MLIPAVGTLYIKESLASVNFFDNFKLSVKVKLYKKLLAEMYTQHTLIKH